MCTRLCRTHRILVPPATHQNHPTPSGHGAAHRGAWAGRRASNQEREPPPSSETGSHRRDCSEPLRTPMSSTARGTRGRLSCSREPPATLLPSNQHITPQLLTHTALRHTSFRWSSPALLATSQPPATRPMPARTELRAQPALGKIRQRALRQQIRQRKVRIMENRGPNASPRDTCLWHQADSKRSPCPTSAGSMHTGKSKPYHFQQFSLTNEMDQILS